MVILYKYKFYPATLIVLVSLLTIIVAVTYMLLLSFDGIEFNGDSFVYFTNAQFLSEAVSNYSFPRSAYWPYGYPALLSIASAVGDATFESARWVNVFVGGLLTAALCYSILFIAQLKKTGDYTAFILILFTGGWIMGHGYFLKYQLSMMSDMSAALWGTLMILGCWRWRISGSLLTIALAGIALGLAVLTRYVYILMVVPALVILLTNSYLYSWISIKKVIYTLLVFTLTAILTFLPQLFITLSNLSSSVGNGLLQGWSIGNFFILTFESIDGHQSSHIPSVVYYALLPFQWKCFTPLASLLLILGFIYAKRELPRWLWLSVIVWYGIMYLLLCGIPIQNSRIGFPLFLPVLIFISLGMLECLIRWKKHFNKLLIAVTVLWFVSLIFTYKDISGWVNIKNELRYTGDLVAKSVPENSSVISTSLYAVYLAYPSSVKPYSIYQMSIPQTEKLLTKGEPVFLAIDEDRFTKQWMTYPPGKCYAWIRSHYSCRVVLKTGEYIIYEVGSIQKSLNN